MEKKKLVVLGTGSISSIAVRCLQGRPDIELVGVWAHAETAGDKIGTDAGLLYSETPIGVTITGDFDALVQSKPDCVFFGLNVQDSDGIIAPMMEKCLLAGVNVVGTSMANMMFPPAYPNPATKQSLEQAAKSGNASLYISGIEPGIMADHLVALLLTCTNTIKKVHTQELMMYDTYPDENTMKYAFGFGMPMEYEPVMMQQAVQVATWGPPIAYVADALGYQLEQFRVTYERAITEKELQVACGTIPAGTVGAVRFSTIGVVEGRDAIIIEHVNRMDRDLVPEWGVGVRDNTYRILIEGDPNMQCDIAIGADDKTAGYEGMVVTCMRALNAVPYVVDAKAGLLTSLELPLTEPSDIFRSDNTVPDIKGYGS